MIIGLHDAESDHMPKKTFPNLALMKLSAYHKAQGDTVGWWNPLMWYDRVYSSKVFDFTPINPYLPPDAIRGGTGYYDIPITQSLPSDVDEIYPDYSIYPECDYAINMKHGTSIARDIIFYGYNRNRLYLFLFYLNGGSKK